MKFGLLLVCIYLLAVSACSSSNSSPPAVTPDVTPDIGVVATATTPSARTRITADNAAGVSPKTSATVDQPIGLVWKEDSSQVLVYNRGTVVSLANQASSRGVQAAVVPASELITTVSGASNGNYMTRSANNTVNLRRIGTMNPVRTLPAGYQFGNAVISKDGTRAALDHMDKIAAQLVDLNNGAPIKELTGFQTAAPVYSLSFSPDGKSLVWLSRALVQPQDIGSGNLGPQIRHEDFVSSLAVRSTGDWIATGAGMRAFVWDAASGASVATLDLNNVVSAVGFSDDGALLAVGTNNSVTFFDARTPALTKLASIQGNVRQLAFAPDGTALAVVDQDGLVTILTP